MKIPSFVRINGIDYPVERVKSLNDGTNIAHGYADFVHNRIQLNPDTQGYEHMCVTLWHEILHILINNAQIEVPDEDSLCGRSLAESIRCFKIMAAVCLILCRSMNRQKKNDWRRKP